MKLSKVLLSSAVAAALVFGFAGCASDESGDSSIIKLNGRNAELYDDDASSSIVNNTSKTTYRRGYKTVNGTNWKGAAYVMTIDTTDQKNNGGVLGVTFDGYDIKNADGNKINNMYVLGMRYYSNKTQIYLSYFEGVGDEQLESDQASSSFGTAEYQLINGGSSSPFYTLSDVTPDENKKVTITVIVYQKTNENRKYQGKYGIAIYNGDITTNGKIDVEKISFGEAELPANTLNIPMATVAYGASGKLFTKYSNATNTDTLESFGVMKNSKGKELKADTAAEGKFGFYASIYPDSSLQGTWTCNDADLEAEPVEE